MLQIKYVREDTNLELFFLEIDLVYQLVFQENILFNYFSTFHISTFREVTERKYNIETSF